MGSTRAEYARIQSGLPGPMQLLPNQLYATADGTPWLRRTPQIDPASIYTTYKQAFEPGIVPPINTFPALTGVFVEQRLQSLIDMASAFHATLGNTFHSKTFVLFSDGLPTDVAYDARESDFNKKVVRLPQGDGTVPSDSGRCPGVPPRSLQNRESFPRFSHATVFSDPDPTFLNAILMRVQTAIGQTMSNAAQ